MNRSYSAASRWTRTNHCHITENGLRFDALFPPVQVSLCDYRPYVLKLCLRDRRVVSWVRTYRTQGTARKYQCCYLLNINDSVTKPPTHDLEPGQQLVAPGCRLSVIIIPGDQLRVDHPSSTSSCVLATIQVSFHNGDELQNNEAVYSSYFGRWLSDCRRLGAG